jgi:NADH dehydrogenase
MADQSERADGDIETYPVPHKDPSRPHVVIVGAGFGGLSAARELRKTPVNVTVIDRTNHHLFQPLLYQVAMAGLSPASIAWPIRSVLSRQRNATTLLMEVEGIDLERKRLVVDDGERRELRYDYLVLAAGARTTYFGHDEWAEYAVGLKDLDDAVEIRRRVLLAFEAAERSKDPEERRRLLTFAVIGGGPTGVELAGALTELSRFVLATDFKSINAKVTRVVLVEAADRVLGTFDPSLSASALRQLQELNVEVRLNTKVTGIDERGVHLGDELLEAGTILWGAGVGASPLAETLGVELDRAKRVVIEKDCSIPGYRDAFVIGDMALFRDEAGKPLPGVSPVAMQQGRFVAHMIARDLEGKKREEFHYYDKGSMATIGRSRAIAEIGWLKLSGFLAWFAWLAVHIFFLIGFKNRVAVLLGWMYSYVVYARGARLITGGRIEAGPPGAEVVPAAQRDARKAALQKETAPRG